MRNVDGKKRITIIGTGLIGGSLGLALKGKGLPGIEIVGYDRERGAASQAEKMRAIDKAEHNLRKAVEGAGMVIIAVPVLAVREVMEEIAPYLAEGAVVTDTASTKAQVMQGAGETLPEHVSFVGGHPMAGKETAGVSHAEASLFQGKAYCVCPSVTATEAAVKGVMGLASVVGAEPLFIDAAEHDVYAAAVSHLPLMVSTALFSMMRESPAWTDLGVMASSGFADVTRLASGDPAMSHGIWTTNRESVIHWLERMSAELNRYRDMLKDARDEPLLQIFAKAQIDREVFLRNPPRRERAASDARVDTGEAMLNMFIGGMMTKQLKRGQELMEMKKQAPEQEEGEDRPRRLSVGEKIAEDVRRELEKLEQKRAQKAGGESIPPED